MLACQGRTRDEATRSSQRSGVIISTSHRRTDPYVHVRVYSATNTCASLQQHQVESELGLRLGRREALRPHFVPLYCIAGLRPTQEHPTRRQIALECVVCDRAMPAVWQRLSPASSERARHVVQWCWSTRCDTGVLMVP